MTGRLTSNWKHPIRENKKLGAAYRIKTLWGTDPRITEKNMGVKRILSTDVYSQKSVFNKVEYQVKQIISISKS